MLPVLMFFKHQVHASWIRILASNWVQMIT